MCVHAHGGASRGGILSIVEKALLAKEDLPSLVLLNPFFYIQLTLFQPVHTQCSFFVFFFQAVFQRLSRQEEKMCFG